MVAKPSLQGSLSTDRSKRPGRTPYCAQQVAHAQPQVLAARAELCRSRTNFTTGKMRLPEGVRHGGGITPARAQTQRASAVPRTARTLSPGAGTHPTSDVAGLSLAPLPKAVAESVDAGKANLDSMADAGGVVLTSKLATRLVAELGDAYQNSPSLEATNACVSSRWGFASAAEMMQCITVQANASYRCR